MRRVAGVVVATLVALAVGCGGDDLFGSGSACSNYRETQYIPAQSDVTFERDGVQVHVHRVMHRTLTVEVTSSDGRYSGDWIDPHGPLAEGLELQTKMGLEPVYNPVTQEWEQQAGQVRPVLHVYDCWNYVSGPDDVF